MEHVVNFLLSHFRERVTAVAPHQLSYLGLPDSLIQALRLSVANDDVPVSSAPHSMEGRR
jgi:hypothetical protein